MTITTAQPWQDDAQRAPYVLSKMQDNFECHMGHCCQQFGALLKKNWILKRRHWISTIVEIILPCFVILGLIWIHSYSTIVARPDSLNLDFGVQFSQRQGISALNDALLASDTYLAIVPGSSATRLVDYLTTADATYNIDADRILTNFETAAELQKYVTSKTYGVIDGSKVIFAGVILDDMMGPNFQYTIRMNATEGRTKYQGVEPTTYSVMDTIDVSYNDNWRKLYLNHGFVTLQSVLDTFILHQTGAFPYAGAPTPADVDNHMQPYFMPFPTPAHRQDDFASFVGGFLGLFFTLVFIWPVTRIVSSIIEEKELKIKQGLIMMGCKETALISSWTVTYLIMFVITSIIIAAMTSSNMYEHSNGALIFVFFFCFCLTVYSFSFLMSTIFSASRTGSTFSAIIFLVIYFLYYLVEGDDVSTGQKFIASLSPTICLSLGATAIARLESSGLGVQNNTTDIVIGNWSYGNTIAMFVIDAILYFLLALYFQQTIPGEFGIARKWYFLCTPRFWCGSSRDRSAGVCSCFFPSSEETTSLANNMVVPELPLDANEPFTKMEAKPPSARALVNVRGLRKTFATEHNPEGFVAVKGLSLDMYEGQVFCLLGENGAGKSTTINMMTGLYAPTEGTAIVNGYDICADMHAVQQTQGVCMQHDILYPNLSVREHMELYASIKGMSGSARDEEITSMIEKVGLGVSGDNKINALAGTLSGGQMRKLSVGIALLNNPSIVYLDEPSSGMDVASQRHIWDLIIASKRGRVIVLTSHSMEEVEVLNDTIGIMAGGKLMCCGSSLFLKDNYGVGYTLTISKAAEATENADKAQLHPGTSTASGSRIAAFMATYYPFAELTSDAGGEIAFRMPFGEAARFPDMFEYFDAHMAELGIVAYGVSVTTMTEVFLKVISAENRELKHLEEGHAVETNDNEDDEWGQMEGVSDIGRAELFRRHFSALFMKRVNYAKRDRKTWMWSVLYPAIILLASLLSQKLAISDSFPTRLMSPTIYEAPNDFQYADVTGNAAIEQVYSYLDAANGGGRAGLGINPQRLGPEVFAASPTGVSVDDMQNYLLDSVYTRPIDNLRSGALAINGLERFPAAAPPADNSMVPTIQYGLYFNYTAQEALPVYLNMMNNVLLRAGTGSTAQSITVVNAPFDKTEKQKAFITASLSFSISIAFCFVSATYVGFLVKERADKAKHLQFVSGVSPLAYWLATYAWDVLNFALPFAMLFILLAIFGIDSLITDGVGPAIVITWVFAFAGAPFVYCISFLFESSSTAQNTTLLLNFLFSVVLLILTVIMSIINSTRDIARHLRFLYRLFPAYCFADTISMITLRDSLYPGTSFWDVEIVGYNLIFLFIDAIIYSALLILLEHWSSSNTLDWLKGGCGSSTIVAVSDENAPADDEEDDVRAERVRIQNGQCDDPARFPIVLKGLRKVYPSRMGAKPHVAVDNLYFSVKKGECLGFLGANGAGKSTTMKQLSGDVYPTSGTALLGGLDILDHPQEVRRLLGYCPQFDALLPLMTGREHLQLFARIKCVPEDKLEGFVNYMIRKLGLVHLADRPAGTYSGGNKRKLSVGLSLIGNPAIVFLDEPSTGVDPQSRRFMWNLISSTMRHRSVILTTHSMEEAQALSDRITIITSGKLRALGTAQYLKSKYGNGWQVLCKVTDGSQANVIEWFQKTFPGTVVVEAHTVNIKLKVPTGTLTLAGIFRIIEGAKASVGVQAYSVSETDLEQIFINFVQADVQRNVEARNDAATA